MKKFFLILLMSLALVSQASAQFDISNLTNKSGAILDEQLAPVTKLLATGLNTGIYVPTSCKLFSIGLQGFGVTFVKEGALSTIDFPVIPVPGYLFVGARIPFLNISAYARGMYIPVPNLPITFLGFGAGYDKTFLVFLNLKAVASFNMFKVDANLSQGEASEKTTLKGDISFQAYSLNVYATVDKIPLVKPYVFAGVSQNKLGLDVNMTTASIPLDIPVKHDNTLTTPHLGVGIHLFKVLSIEGNLLPKMSVSASLGFAL